MYRTIVLSTCALLATTAVTFAQNTNVVTRSTRAVGYTVGAGDTTIGFKATDLMPQASGQAKVQAKQGYTEIEAEFKQLSAPTKFGAEFLTFVLWAVTPDGRASNLGEIITDQQGSGKPKVSTQMQTFSLLVTAEPYFAVRIPSELVILENELLKNTKGKIFPVDNYSLMKRGQYQKLANPLALTLDLKSQPLDLYEARNAVAIAKSNSADKYATEIYTKAEASLQMAENALKSKADRKQLVSTSRQAVQFSQDALTLAVQRQEEELLASERKAREDAERAAREQAHQETLRRAQAEADKARAEAAQVKAQLEQQQASIKAQEEARLRSEAEAKSRESEAARQTALGAQHEAEEAVKRAIAEKAELRARLLEQFSRVLETRDTERGLVVNMSDVLFDTGKFTLRAEAREKLARIVGIVVNYPKLRLESEGHTDNVGSADFNQKLSEQRAEAVRLYMTAQGVPQPSITSIGRGFSVPVGSNDNAAGRQMNRRVELIVSGEIIGAAVGKPIQ
jgi:outer membrane protein OmpA-like peptidoglycan-associated protein